MSILTSKIVSGLKNCRFMGIKRIFPNPNHLETGFLTLNISSNSRLSDKQVSEIVLFKETENIKKKMILVNDFVSKNNLSKEEIIRQLNAEGVNIENIPVVASSSFMDEISPDTFFENFGNIISMEALINEKTKTKLPLSMGDLIENLSILSNWIYMKENYNCNTHVTSNDFLVEESFDFMSSVYDQDDFSVIIID